jgi:hypothetical protein
MAGIRLAASAIIVALAVAGIASAIAISVYYLSLYPTQYTSIERFPGPDAISVSVLGSSGDVLVINRAGYPFQAAIMVYASNGTTGSYYGRIVRIPPGENTITITDLVPPGLKPDFTKSYMIVGRLAIPISKGIRSQEAGGGQATEQQYSFSSYRFGSAGSGAVKISQYWDSLYLSNPQYTVEGSYPRRTSYCDQITREITKRTGERAAGMLYGSRCGWCCAAWEATTCCWSWGGFEYCYTCYYCVSPGETPYSYEVGPDSVVPAVSDYRDYFCTNYYYGYYEDVLAYLRGSYRQQDIAIAVIRGAEWGQRDERRGYQYPSIDSRSYLVVTGDIIPVENTRYTWEWWNYWVRGSIVSYTVAFGGCPNCASIDRTATIYEEYSKKIASEIRYGCEGYNYGATDCKRVMRIDDMGSNISYIFYPTPDGRAEGEVNITIKARITLENDPQAIGSNIRIPLSLGFDIVGGRAIYEVSLPKLPRPPLLYGGGSIAIYPSSITAYINNKRVDIYFNIWSSDLNKGYVSLSPVSLAQGNIETYTGSINLGTSSLRMNTVIDVSRNEITTCGPTYVCEYRCWWWCWYSCWWATTCTSTANIEINITLKIIITPIAELRSQ